MADVSARTLDGIGILKSLSVEERAALAKRCSWRVFQVDEQIIDHMSETRDACFVVSGMVRVVNHSLSGREISFDDIAAGGFLGELSAIDGGARSASVVASRPDTVIAFLAPKAFRELVTGHEGLALEVMRRLCSVVRQSTERIMDLSTLAANNRVQAELLRLATPHERDDGSAVIDPVPVHSDIASRVSTTRETVARVLSELGRDKIVVKKGQALVIPDLEDLRELVENVRGAV